MRASEHAVLQASLGSWLPWVGSTWRESTPVGVAQASRFPLVRILGFNTEAGCRHCREGLVRRVEDVAAEFCKARGAEAVGWIGK